MKKETCVDLPKLIEAVKFKFNLNSDKEVADKLNVSRGHLSNVAKGRVKLGKPLKLSFINVFDVNPDYLNGTSNVMWRESISENYSDMEVQDRIECMLDAIKGEKGYKSNEEISKVLGKGVNFFSDLKKKKVKIDKKTSVNLANIFGINPLFLSGESGELWLSSHHSSISGDANTNVQGNNNSIVTSALFEKQQKLTEQANEIALNAQRISLETNLRLADVTRILDKLTDKK